MVNARAKELKVHQFQQVRRYINTAVVTKYRIHAAIRASSCTFALAVIITPVGHIFRLEDCLAVKATAILTVFLSAARYGMLNDAMRRADSLFLLYSFFLLLNN